MMNMQRKGREVSPSARQPLMLESLEPRILLTAVPFIDPSALEVDLSPISIPDAPLPDSDPIASESLEWVSTEAEQQQYGGLELDVKVTVDDQTLVEQTIVNDNFPFSIQGSINAEVSTETGLESLKYEFESVYGPFETGMFGPLTLTQQHQGTLDADGNFTGSSFFNLSSPPPQEPDSAFLFVSAGITYGSDGLESALILGGFGLPIDDTGGFVTGAGFVSVLPQGEVIKGGGVFVTIPIR